jgi:DNA topoisomerase VI subunit A
MNFFFVPNHPLISHDDENRNELEQMKQVGRKAEIEAIQHINVTQLSSVYLPNKIARGEWL